jgi:hypothetical protein
MATAATDVRKFLSDTDPQALIEADENDFDGTGNRIKTRGLRCVLTRSTGLTRKDGGWHPKDLDDEDCISCYDLRMPRFYTNMCRLFLFPLFATETGSFELLSKLRASLQSMQGGCSILEDESHKLIAKSLSSPIPPALLLRVALMRLQSAIPHAHPERAVRSGLGTFKCKFRGLSRICWNKSPLADILCLYYLCSYLILVGTEP